uniref:ZAD domain-containing protein n=1 Tax=Anopheles maculatus TaxID=74869 RepID=A0A182S8P0_9DIPT
MLNGVAVPTTYAAKCRLCLGDKFDKNSTTIIEEEFSRMMQKVFCIPITNKIGLPMNVCSKCYRKVKIFYQYSTAVVNNQMKMEESLLSAAAHNRSTLLAPAQIPDTTLVEEIEEGVIDIASDDGSAKEREDETMDADLPCVTITADARNDPLVEPPDIEDAEQTHF